MSQKYLYVLLGRFAPIHKGHQKLIDTMLGKYGSDNCMIIIGSSTSLNERTPFTYSQRKKMVSTLYPGLKIFGLPDTKPDLQIFEDKYLSIWNAKIKKLENDLNKKFIFCSGSRSDISHLDKSFSTEILFSRFSEGQNISATKVREVLKSNNNAVLRKYLDERIIGLVVKEFKKFPNGVNI